MSKISIVVPVYYNADTLMLLYEDMKQKILGKLGEYELVFVDDGSGDNSWEVMNEIRRMDQNVQCVKQADRQEDSEIILEMYESWKKCNKVVLAVRKERDENPVKKFFAHMYYVIIHKFVQERMPVGGCDCYLIDRQVIEVLERLDEKNSSLTLQVLWAGFQTDQIYFHRRDREIGKSRWTLGKKVKLAMDSMMSFSYAPIRFMSGVGVVFFIIALLMMI